MGALDRVFRGRRGGQERPAAAIVAGLWKNGEQGVWYDPSDMSTLFQDAAGTTPVYMPGQGQVDPPVGLLLDNRLGLARGPERLINGDFAAGGNNWTVSGADATHIATFSGGTLRFQSDTTSPVMLVQQPGAMVIGRWYEITVTVSAWVSGSLKSDNFVQAGLPLASGAGVYKVIGLSSGTTFAFLRASANVDLTIDSISIREVLGNHAYQSTTTSRPVLSARYNLLTATEFPNGISDAPSRAGLVTASALPGYAGALAFGYDGVNTSYAYKAGSPASTTMTLSFVVKMDDGGAPSFGVASGAANSDFALVLRNASIPPATYQVVNLGGGYYRVSGTQASGVGSDGSGIVKYAGNSPRTFKVTAFDLRPANDGVGLPPYQRVVDANTYDTVGFPLYLKFDGVDDWMQTANVDFSGTDVVAIATAYRKMSDVSVGELFALSGNPTANAGTFGFYAPETAGGVAAAVFFARGASSIISGQRLGTAPISCVAGGWASLSMPYMRYRINQGVSLTSSVATGGGNYGIYPLFIGRRNGTSFPFNGRLYSLLIRGAATPDTTIATVERHLNQKARIY